MGPFRTLAMALVALILAGCGAAEEPAAERQGPVVLAASSLQEALEDAADAWAAKGHPRPVLSFAGSSALARQVEGGAPADLFLSADREWMDYLAERNLLRPETRRVVAGNALVLVGAPGTAPLTEQGLAQELAGKRIAMADPAAVPAGRYGKAALESLGLWRGVERLVVPAENVRAALALVERGEVPLAVVYATDATASGKVAVVHRFGPSRHPPIAYPLALLAASRHPEAEGFAAFLLGHEGQALLAARGFAPAP